MSATVLSMSMSLDGFIAGPNEGPGNGLGDGGHRLHEWLLTDGAVDLDTIRGRGGVNGRVLDELMSTGAVVAGRGTFEPAGGWGGDHHDGVPIFIVARGRPGIDISHWPLVTYVGDVTSAMTQAKRAAGEENVLVHGAGGQMTHYMARWQRELSLVRRGWISGVPRRPAGSRLFTRLSRSARSTRPPANACRHRRGCRRSRQLKGRGITGNGHFAMVETNRKEVFEVIRGWIESKIPPRSLSRQTART